jgi:hypothetical protein
VECPLGRLTVNAKLAEDVRVLGCPTRRFCVWEFFAFFYRSVSGAATLICKGAGFSSCFVVFVAAALRRHLAFAFLFALLKTEN